MHQVVPLEMLVAGEEARVVEIDGQSAFVDRLAEMGLRAGVVLRMVKPGQPCILAIDNHRLSFRCDEAAAILVEVLGVVAT